MAPRTVGVAAEKLVDPGTRQILDADRWDYAVALSRLLQELGHQVIWWQLGDGWRGEILPEVPLLGALPASCQFLTWPTACESFLERANGVDLAIYFDLALAYPQVHEVSVAVAHGVTWDGPLFASRLPTAEEREEWKRRLGIALRNPLKVVTADAGLIHWAQATWPGLQYAFEYIPGFSLPPPALAARSDGPVTVLFPGPFTPERGIGETIRAMEALMVRHGDLRFRLSGRGEPAVEEYLAEWVERHQGATLDRLPLTYDLLGEVDIALFPVKSGPGPILACLRAMAAGKAVIVGWAGGLSGLVLQEHTGKIVSPGAESLAEAIEELALHPAKRRLLADNAREAVAHAFSLERWRRRWTRLAEKLLD
ncbi:MAG: glycosyltransferase family 4 protein [bacterium]|nr:glycosyltransferase family 4 protein [bacterium]